MSWAKHDDQCPGCLPAILDLKSGKPLPGSDPIMQATMSVWNQTTKEEREAFHQFMCNNSQDPKVFEIVNILNEKILAAINFTKERKAEHA